MRSSEKEEETLVWLKKVMRNKKMICLHSAVSVLSVSVRVMCSVWALLQCVAAAEVSRVKSVSVCCAVQKKVR